MVVDETACLVLEAGLTKEQAREAVEARSLVSWACCGEFGGQVSEQWGHA
ncbi:hypothetical protein R2A130_3487 [Ahrensia sp. R2A130]|nr:hypothetical protein R2A130_3487 [Ahrensia sp. R2A130]